MLLSSAVFLKMFDPDRVKQLATDASGTYGRNVYDATIVTQILTDVDGTIKNALSKQYTVAEIEADDGLIRIAGDMAMYLLECRRGTPPKPVTTNYKVAKDRLSSLQEGTSKLAAVTQLLPSIAETDLGDEEEAEITGFFD